MRVIVCGAGMVGVATACELGRRGLDVVVVDRRDGPAQAGAAAMSGLAGMAGTTPWPQPNLPWRYLARLGDPVTPMLWRPRASWAQWRWLGRFLRRCDAADARRALRRIHRLIQHSRRRWRDVQGELGFDAGMNQGALQLFRTLQEREAAQPFLFALRQGGVASQLLDPDLCLAIEPGLIARDGALHGGLFLPDDESGDGPVFADRLAGRLAELGARFRYDLSIESIAAGDAGVVGVATRDLRGRGELIEADAVVLAAGFESAKLAAPLGLDLPIHPVRRHAMTLAIANEAFAPRAAIHDEAFRTSIVRVGDRVRVSGTFELSGEDPGPRGVLCNTLLKVARDWFPKGLAIPVSPSFSVGRMAMTPDGPPLIGPTEIPGLFVNSGHGPCGWAMAFGSGAILADLIAESDPGVDLDGLTMARYAPRARA